MRVLLRLFWTRLFLDLELWTRLWFYIHFVFEYHLWSTCLHHLEAIQLISNANQFIDLHLIWTLWSKCIVLTLYMFYLFYFSIYLYYMVSLLLSVDIINFNVCSCCYCCLLIFFIHFVVVVPVLLFILFHFIFFYAISIYCRLSVLFCWCCQYLLAPFLFSFLTHRVSYLSYCHCCLYNSALVLLVWLLIPLVYNFLYDNRIVTYHVK